MPDVLNVIVVDDEPQARENLSSLLTQFCGARVIAKASSANDCLSILATESPDAIFLDIELGDINGIELAQKIQHRNIPIVFVTAFDNYAVNAFKASALDYILKPATVENLREAINRIDKKVKLKQRQSDKNDIRLDSLQANMKNSDSIQCIAVPWEHGFKIVNLKDVIHITSENSYSELVEMDQTILVSKSIGELEDMLTHSGFYRIHNRHLINLHYLDSFTNQDGGNVMLKTGKSLPVSRRRLAGFKLAVGDYFNS